MASPRGRNSPGKSARRDRYTKVLTVATRCLHAVPSNLVAERPGCRAARPSRRKSRALLPSTCPGATHPPTRATASPWLRGRIMFVEAVAQETLDFPSELHHMHWGVLAPSISADRGSDAWMGVSPFAGTSHRFDESTELTKLSIKVSGIHPIVKSGHTYLLEYGAAIGRECGCAECAP